MYLRADTHICEVNLYSLVIIVMSFARSASPYFVFSHPGTVSPGSESPERIAALKGSVSP